MMGPKTKEAESGGAAESGKAVEEPKTAPNGIVFYFLAAVFDRVAQFFSPVPETPPSDITKQRADITADVTKASHGLTRLKQLLGKTSHTAEKDALEGTMVSDIARLEKMHPEIQAAKTVADLQEISIEIYAMLGYYSQMSAVLQKDDTAEPWWQLMFNATGSGLINYASDYAERVAREFGGADKIPAATLPGGEEGRSDHPKRSVRLLLSVWMRALSNGLQPAGSKPDELASLWNLSKYAVESKSKSKPSSQGQSFSHFPPFDSKNPTDENASPVNASLWAFNKAMEEAQEKPALEKVAAETAAVLAANKKLNHAFKAVAFKA